MKKYRVLQFICPTGFYGAERWILALTNNNKCKSIDYLLAVTKEPKQNEPDILSYFNYGSFVLKMKNPYDISVINNLCKLIKEQHVDIIHTHGYKSDIIGLIAARITNIKCISTPHGFENTKSIKLRAYVKIGVYFLRYFDAVAPLSKELKFFLCSSGIKAEKIKYIRNGVDLAEIDNILNKNNNIDELHAKDYFTIGYIGQLISRKNVDHILDIFDKLWKKYNNLQLTIVGDGVFRNRLENYATQLKSSKAIKFLGFRQDRLNILENFDLFIMTSSYEGVPRCMMEAMAMNIPVAAYDIPGIDQLIMHNETGLLAEYEDKDELTTYCEKILFDRKLSEKLKFNARLLIKNKFSAERMSDEYIKLFHSLLSV